MSYKDKLLRDVNSISIDADLLIAANEIHGDMSPEDRLEIGAFAIELFKLVDELDVKGDRATITMAISWRLEALARLQVREHPEMKGWILPSDETGMVFANEELFRTAAVEEIIDIDDRPAFEPRSFFRNLLSLASARGEA